ncbi:MAG: HEAT repeat domain-containing protein [Chloroflexi bacterium]|nr:HEAT repeat domain-containing protein [Chloroflexota bacterium]
MLAERGGPEVVEPILSQLSSSHPAQVQAAMEAIGSLKDEGALARLFSLVPFYPKELIAEALLSYGSGIIPQVGPLVTADDPTLRAWAVDILCQIEAPSVEVFLREALRDPQALVRAAAGVALARRGQATGELLALLRHEAEVSVKCALAEALAEAGRKEASPVLGDALLQLAELRLPWDARMRLWQSLVKALEKLGSLEMALMRLASFPSASLQRWLETGVVLVDVDVLCLVLYYLGARQEPVAALEKVRQDYGQRPLEEGLEKGLARGGVHREAALEAIKRLYPPAQAPGGEELKTRARPPEWKEMEARLTELLPGKKGEVRPEKWKRMEAGLAELSEAQKRWDETEAALAKLFQVEQGERGAPPRKAPPPQAVRPPVPAPDDWEMGLLEARQVLSRLGAEASGPVPPVLARQLLDIVSFRLVPQVLAAAKRGDEALVAFLSRLVEAAPVQLLSLAPFRPEPAIKQLWASDSFLNWARATMASRDPERRLRGLALTGWAPVPGLSNLLLQALQDAHPPVRLLAVSLLSAHLARLPRATAPGQSL